MKLIKAENIPINARIKFGKYQVEQEVPEDIIWIVIKNGYHDSGYPTGIFLFAEKILDLRMYDNVEDGYTFGNGRYLLSNIRHFLNSDKDNWFIPSHPKDNPPDYSTHKGFLYYFTEKEKEMLSLVTPEAIVANESFTERISDKIFLLSEAELGYKRNYGNHKAGKKFEYFSTYPNESYFATLTEQCKNNSLELNEITDGSKAFWTRDQTNGYPSYAIVSAFSSIIGDYCIVKRNGIRPACVISHQQALPLYQDKEGYYRFYYPNKKYIYFKNRDIYEK